MTFKNGPSCILALIGVSFLVDARATAVMACSDRPPVLGKPRRTRPGITDIIGRPTRELRPIHGCGQKYVPETWGCDFPF